MKATKNRFVKIDRYCQASSTFSTTEQELAALSKVPRVMLGLVYETRLQCEAARLQRRDKDSYTSEVIINFKLLCMFVV